MIARRMWLKPQIPDFDYVKYISISILSQAVAL